jgi:thioredoxin:protein disulfide reductase
VAANDSGEFPRFKANIILFLLYRSTSRLIYSARMRISLFFLVLLLASSAYAKPWWMRGVESNENDFLPPDVAFRVAAGVEDNVFRVRWVIADGYYLYKHKIEIKAESPDLMIAAPNLPQGQLKVDPYFGNQEIYRQQVAATAAYTRLDAGAHPLQIKVTYQGCADAGLCYPPITKVIYPQHPLAVVTPTPHPFTGIAIVGGIIAFLLAGLALRKDRKLDLPAA